MNDRTENRSSNRTNNCKSQNRTSNRTENRMDDRTENRATNEHKHPNQYTKGADDESAKTPRTAVPATPETAANAALRA